MGYNYIPKYIRQSENKSPKSVVTASRWNTLFNLLIQQGDYTAEELGKILDYLSTEVDDRANEKLDKTGGVITGNLGVTGKLNIGTTVSITETNNNLLQLAGDYGAPVTISNVDTPVADNDAATKKYVDEHTGDASESVLYVNITQSDSGRITGDKTYDEILAAVTAGKCVIAKLADQSFCLDSVSNDKITFQRLDIVEDDGEGRRSIQKTLIYVYNDGVWAADVEFVAVDTAMSDTSRMPVQNKVVKAYIDGIKAKVPTKTSQLTNDSGFLTSHQDISGKQDKLIAGENITIASDGKTISATGGGAETLFVTITDNNGTLTADKSFVEIKNAINTGIPVLVDYYGTGLPLIQAYADGLAFGTFTCDESGVATVIIEITPNGEVNDISAVMATLPNPQAITFTGAVTGSYDGSAPLSVNIPTVPTKTSQLTNDSGYLTLATLPKYGGEVV